jgi:hypothetical protein
MAVSENLKKLYADASEQGLYVREFPSRDGPIAFVASKRKLANAGFDTEEKRKKMDLFSCNVWMIGGGGETREEAVQAAINMFKSSEDWIPTV